MRNRWITAAVAVTILFVVVVLIVIGCSMKNRAPAKLPTSKSAGKSTQQAAHKIRTERKRANARYSAKPCVIAPSVTPQRGNTALTEDGISGSTHAIPQDDEAARSHSATPSVIRIIVAVETEKQPDPAFRLFQPPAQAGRRPPNSGWQHFRPQAGD